MFSTGGGGRGLGHFQTGLIRESREITLRNARRKIEALAQQLSLRRDRIDMAFHFFKLGTILHKMSLKTIFGHKHFRQKFHQKI